MKTTEELSEETQWWNEVVAYAATLNYPIADKEEWIKMYYEDGYGPEEAVNEDLSYCN